MAIQVTYRRTRRLSIPSLAVLPEYRRQGIAQCLLHATKENANKVGQPCVGLLVDKGNPAGEALYASVGFKYDGSRCSVGEEHDIPNVDVGSSISHESRFYSGYSV